MWPLLGRQLDVALAVLHLLGPVVLLPSYMINVPVQGLGTRGRATPADAVILLASADMAKVSPQYPDVTINVASSAGQAIQQLTQLPQLHALYVQHTVSHHSCLGMLVVVSYCWLAAMLLAPTWYQRSGRPWLVGAVLLVPLACGWVPAVLPGGGGMPSAELTAVGRKDWRLLLLVSVMAPWVYQVPKRFVHLHVCHALMLWATQLWVRPSPWPASLLHLLAAVSLPHLATHLLHRWRCGVHISSTGSSSGAAQQSNSQAGSSSTREQRQQQTQQPGPAGMPSTQQSLQPASATQGSEAARERIRQLSGSRVLVEGPPADQCVMSGGSTSGTQPPSLTQPIPTQPIPTQPVPTQPQESQSTARADEQVLPMEGNTSNQAPYDLPQEQTTATGRPPQPPSSSSHHSNQPAAAHLTPELISLLEAVRLPDPSLSHPSLTLPSLSTQSASSPQALARSSSLHYAMGLVSQVPLPYEPLPERAAKHLAIKIPGADPEDLAPTWPRDLQAAMQTQGLALHATWLRRGCIDLLVCYSALPRGASRSRQDGANPTGEDLMFGLCLEDEEEEPSGGGGWGEEGRAQEGEEDASKAASVVHAVQALLPGKELVGLEVRRVVEELDNFALSEGEPHDSASSFPISSDCTEPDGSIKFV